MRIFRYLKENLGAVVLIVLLLVVQAYCDLSLPAYTSDIVDVGIQQGGIDSAVPEKISEATLTELKLFMTDDEIAAVDRAYQPDADGNYVLTAKDEDERDRLDAVFSTPMVVVSQLRSEGDGKLDQIQMALSAGMVTKEALLGEVSTALESAGEGSDSLLGQMAVAFVKSEYEALGMDTGKIQTDYLLLVGAKMLGVTLLSVIAAVIVGLLASRTAAGVGMRLRSRVFGKVVSFSNAELDRFSTASLITRSTNDIQQVQMVIVMLLRMVLYAPIIGVGGIIKVAHTETGMGWIIGVAVALITVVVVALMVIAMPKFKKMQSLVDRLNLVSREILTGVPVIRAFSREKHEEERFDGANRDLMKTQLFTNRVMTFMMPMMMFLMNGISIMIVWFGGKGIDQGNLQVGDMMAFITYTMQICMAFMMITMISIMLPRANVAAGRIDEVLATEPTIEDKETVLDETKAFQGVVEFHDVSFHYPGADGNVLEHIDFTALPGKTTAIIGSTGSGKSTLVHLIPRFYDVTEGSITIDGVDVRDLSQKKLHSLLGFVPQKGVLFSGDIESNLKFGGDDISDEAMMEAASIAQASDFIAAKEEGVHSPIAQGGTNVSGGQKQRLSIARAIAKNPQVYIFDDSFSALDYKTDVVLRKALSEKVGDATVIIVAQRISTILHADQIIVLDDGKIAGIGRHEELLAGCPTYQEIARSQLSAKELGEKEGDAQ